ncbi:MAG: metallophosphoesterase [Planctomycetota bacterium]
MPQRFNTNRPYRADLDVRDHSALLGAILDGFESIVMPVIANRRAGKTWLLKYLEEAVERQEGRKAKFYDLHVPKDVLDFFSTSPRADVLLLDEACQVLQTADNSLIETHDSSFQASLFLARCKKLAKHGNKSRTIVLALSPGEWSELRASQLFDKCIQRQDIRFLEPMKREEQEKLAGRDGDQTLLPLLDQLSDAYCQSPFLLETALKQCEQNPELVNDAKLAEVIIDAVSGSELPYFRQVFDNGLSAAQRSVIREARSGLNLRDYKEKDESEVLKKCRTLSSSGGTVNPPMKVVDPLLRACLPEPLRIHQISDIHISGWHARAGEVKGSGPEAQATAAAAGADLPLWKRYASELERAPAQERPNLLIVSGDIGEHGSTEHYTEFRDWLRKVRDEQLAPHPSLKDEPRVLLVGGNHDVVRRDAIDKDDPQRRHQAFAESFAEFPHPNLHLPPEERTPQVVNYGELGLSVLLLGSSECGQELTGNENNRELVAKLEHLENVLENAQSFDEWNDAIKALDTIDPGLVHHSVLDQLRDENWRQSLVRIAVVHHPISPLPSDLSITPYNGMINAAAVKSVLLRQKVSLVLHGHLHKSWLGYEAWPGVDPKRGLHIASCPSLGSSYSTTSNGNGFQEIELRQEGDRNELTVSQYEFDGATNWDVIDEITLNGNSGLPLPSFA